MLKLNQVSKSYLKTQLVTATREQDNLKVEIYHGAGGLVVEVERGEECAQFLLGGEVIAKEAVQLFDGGSRSRRPINLDAPERPI